MTDQKQPELFSMFKPCGMEVQINEKSLPRAVQLKWTREAPKKAKK